ncbi:MAG TPA: SDR family NAD(P)-dependent oxidoreductase, partial [Nitrososphaeraceae archaeon]|nr:SDR family NAD(P)-dependent oxidoreductase [Nitrososphaeraceae archaeon]
MLYLEGKIGIVTGAAGGLGFEIAKELTKNGATVIITSRKKTKLTKACNLINKNCHGFELDVSNRKSVLKFIGKISKKFDSVDILINNAGFPFEKKIWFKKIHG